MTRLDVSRSEWVKLRSLRSTVGALVAVFVLTVGFGAMVCILVKDSEVASPDFDPLRLSFYGLTFGQIAAISFGTLVMSQEFRRDALIVTLCAVPRRGVLYLGKLAVTAGAALVVGLLSAFVAFLLGQALLGDAGIALTDDGALRAVIGSGVYLALMALMATGLTALLRSGVAVLAVLIPLLLIVPYVFVDFASGVGRYLPDRAGHVVIAQYPDGPIGPWAAVGVTALWAFVAVAAGWLAMRRRDL